MMDDYVKMRSDGAIILDNNNVELVGCLSCNNKRRKLIDDTSIKQNNVVSSSSASPTSSSISSIYLNQKANGFETNFSVFIAKAFSSKESSTTMMMAQSSSSSNNKEIMKYVNSTNNKMKKKPTMACVTPPIVAEIEDFFSLAEKYDQNRFAQKYNYDIVKDVPLEGRYQWVKLKP